MRIKVSSGNQRIISVVAAIQIQVERKMRISASQKRLDFRPHRVQHVEQFVVGVHQMQRGVGVLLRKRYGESRGDYSIALSMENQRWLEKIGIILVKSAIFHQAVRDSPFSAFTVMRYG